MRWLEINLNIYNTYSIKYSRSRRCVYIFSFWVCNLRVGIIKISYYNVICLKRSLLQRKTNRRSPTICISKCNCCNSNLPKERLENNLIIYNITSLKVKVENVYTFLASKLWKAHFVNLMMNALYSQKPS